MAGLRRAAILAALLIGTAAAVPGLLAGLLVIALGRMLTEPTFTEIVASLAPPQSLATYVGLGFVGLGLGGALGTLSAGMLFDLALRLEAHWLPWLVYGLIGIALAILFSRLHLPSIPRHQGGQALGQPEATAG